VICSGSLKGITEVETGEELELAPRTFESVGCVLAMVPREVLLLMASAFELSATGPPRIGATDADGFCKVGL